MTRRNKKKKMNTRFYVICFILIIALVLGGYFGIKTLAGGGEKDAITNKDPQGLNQQVNPNAEDPNSTGQNPTVPTDSNNPSLEIPLVTSTDGTPVPSAATIANTEHLYQDAYIIANPDSYSCIVNRKYNLPPDYEPADLVKVSVPFAQRSEEVKYMRTDANDALTQMFEAAKAEQGYILYGASGYRSYSVQTALFKGNAQKKGSIETANKTSALPGQSEHQLGLAMDITCESMNLSLTENFYNTPEGKWVTDNCHRFGFIIRYPADKTEITGYMYEPWHCRYVGLELAKELYESGLTMEEYYGLT